MAMSRLTMMPMITPTIPPPKVAEPFLSFHNLRKFILSSSLNIYITKTIFKQDRVIGYGSPQLKKVHIWLNEEQYKFYVKATQKLGLSEYGLTKKLVVDFIEGRQREQKKFLILYFFIVYSLAATALLLVT